MCRISWVSLTRHPFCRFCPGPQCPTLPVGSETDQTTVCSAPTRPPTTSLRTGSGSACALGPGFSLTISSIQEVFRLCGPRARWGNFLQLCFSQNIFAIQGLSPLTSPCILKCNFFKNHYFKVTDSQKTAKAVQSGPPCPPPQSPLTAYTSRSLVPPSELRKGQRCILCSPHSGRHSGVPVLPLVSFPSSGIRARKPRCTGVTLLSLLPAVTAVGLSSSRPTTAAARSHARDSYSKTVNQRAHTSALSRQPFRAVPAASRPIPGFPPLSLSCLTPLPPR